MILKKLRENFFLCLTSLGLLDVIMFFDPFDLWCVHILISRYTEKTLCFTFRREKKTNSNSQHKFMLFRVSHVYSLTETNSKHWQKRFQMCVCVCVYVSDWNCITLNYSHIYLLENRDFPTQVMIAKWRQKEIDFNSCLFTVAVCFHNFLFSRFLFQIIRIKSFWWSKNNKFLLINFCSMLFPKE